MGRSIPHHSTSKSSIMYKGSPFFFLVATIVASLAIFIGLCVSHHRKSSGHKSKQTASSSSSSSSSPSSESLKKTSNEKTHMPTLSPPLPKENVEKTLPTPRRKLSASLSMRFPEGLAKIKTRVKKDKQHASSNAEEVVNESLWMKTIILGEKCRVDSDDEDELVMYDEKGNKKRNYHPRTPRSLPVSRTNSFAFSERNGS